MKLLTSMHLVQFSFFDADSFDTRGNMAFLGANGVGKTSLLDALQIAILGAHGSYMAFNSQSVASHQKRSLRDYCLGAMQPDGRGSKHGYKRDYATSYITLVFKDTERNEVISAGVCVQANIHEPKATLLGLYILHGDELMLEDHLEALEEGQTAMQWSLFEQELLRRASHRDNLYISKHPEEYSAELLKKLQPSSRFIDRHAFMRAFKKSLELKDVEEVNAFVRDYLIEPSQIDRKSALAQITQFHTLKDIIRNTEEQIETLNDIAKEFNGLGQAYKRHDTVLAVQAVMRREETDNRLDELEGLKDEANERIEKADRDLERLGKELSEFRSKIDSVIAQIATDPSAANIESIKSLRNVLQLNCQTETQAIVRFASQLRTVLSNLGDVMEGQDAAVLEALNKTHGQWDMLLDSKTPAIPELLQSTMKQIELLQGYVDTIMEEAKACETALDAQFRTKSGQLIAKQRGAGDVSDPVADAIEEFQRRGITAIPVCQLLEITDSNWQGAIETYLGSNRESLIVTPGREREAISVIRRQGGDWVYSVNVVIPSHLTDYGPPAKDTVAALIKSDNETARLYVRQIFGTMKCVKTEEELEGNKRAMTDDGMLAKNGSIKRNRLLISDKWLIGSHSSQDDIRILDDEVRKLYSALEKAKSRNLALQRIKPIVLAQIDAEPYLDAIKRLKDAQTQLARQPDPEHMVVSVYVAELRSQEKALNKAHEQCSTEKEQVQGKRLLDATNIKNYEEEISKRQQELVGLGEDCDKRMGAEDYDESLFSTLYEEVNRNEVQDKHKCCETIRERADEKIRDLSVSTMRAFNNYLSLHKVTLGEEREKWRPAQAWVKVQQHKLETSDLVRYKEQADAALKASQKSFHVDIALKIREAIKRQNVVIDNLNKILMTCPVFSSNERYQFTAKVTDAYKDIHQYILDSSVSDTDTLFKENEPIQKRIMEYMEDASTNIKSENPIEDYRLLFNFDLRILVEGQEVNLLSDRIGLASNGEHRVPFYVIAGAALASAYRIDPAKPKQGAAIMLLDEAFYGMDTQNSEATASLLKSLGLQLIMAGPEADQSKLAPMTDTMYSLARFGQNVHCTQVHIKEPLQTLMKSDMPMLHPNLIDMMEARLQEVT